MAVIEQAIKEAIAAREKAITFKTSVGAAITTKDGNIFSGFNIESYGYFFELHAEGMAVINGMQDGYHGTDYDTLVVIFQSGWHGTNEVFPGCPYCWAFLNDFTNPDLKIVCATTTGTVIYSTTLKQCIHPPSPATLYPSDLIRKVKPRLGTEPKIK